MDTKDLWDLESALKVLTHDSVDSKLWAEAVEWLILYGPPEIRQLLLNASATATSTLFPELTPSHYTPDGQPCYNIAELAASLNLTEEETKEILRKKEQEHQLSQLLDNDVLGTVH